MVFVCGNRCGSTGLEIFTEYRLGRGSVPNVDKNTCNTKDSGRKITNFGKKVEILGGTL